jgi:hypothetical protein
LAEAAATVECAAVAAVVAVMHGRAMAPQAEVLMIAAMMVLAAREVMCFVILIATLRLVYFELFCSLAINVWRIAFRKLSSAEGRSIAGYRKL